MSSVVIVVLSIVTVCVICTLVAVAIVFLRRYSRTRGDYYTQVTFCESMSSADTNVVELEHICSLRYQNKLYLTLRYTGYF